MKRFLLFMCLYGTYVNTTTFVVTNTNDAGAGSLRQAIQDADADLTPPTFVTFNIPGVGPHTITPTTFYSTVPSPKLVYQPLTQAITIDGTTQPGFSTGNPQIVIDCTTVAAAGGTGNCLTIRGADNCSIKGLVISKYVGGASGRAIVIQNTASHGANNNQISQCVCGVFGAGFGNTRGIIIDGSASNTFLVTNTIIGGQNATDFNVLSGNSISGIAIMFNVNDSLIQNNFIGCDKTGTIALGEAYGIVIIGGSGSTTQPCTGNVIKDNVIAGYTSFGIVLQSATNSNIVQNNKIGTNISGTAALDTPQIGVLITNESGFTCTNNLIGGTNSGEGNLISGQTGGGVGAGIYLNDGANSTTIQGNFIGTNLAGTAAIPNLYGIEIQNDPGFSCENNSIGGSASGAQNLISGNTTAGILLDTNVLNTTIQNNLIGVQANGTSALANGIGIATSGSITSNQPIDGTSITSNVISANTGEGIKIGPATTNSIITANFIGTDRTNSVALGNGNSGILFAGTNNNPSSSNLIGGTTASAKNIIVNNGVLVTPNYGIFFNGNSTTPDILDSILGNSIFNNNNNGIKLTNNGNHLQPYPTLTKAQIWKNVNQIRIQGTAPATPAASFFRIEFFVNSLNRNPITEGQNYIGAISSIASGASFDVILTGITPSLVAGQWVSSTATNLNNSNGPGDTSEFSLNQEIDPILLASLTASPTLIVPAQSSQLTLTITGDGPFTLVWSDGLVQAGIVTTTVTRTVSPLSTTTYYVTVTDSHSNSVVSNSVTVIVSPESALNKAIRAKYCKRALLD